jgi:signal transduction histidine kinase
MKNRVWRYGWLWCLLLISGGMHTHAREINNQRVNLNSAAEYISTTSQDMQPLALLGNDSLPWKKVGSRGFSKPYDNLGYWLRIPLRIQTGGTYFLENNYPMLEEFRGYLIEGNGIMHYLGNEGLRHPTREAFNPLPVFRMELHEGNYLLYLYMGKKFSTSAQSLTFYHATAYATQMRTVNFQNGIVYGIFAFLLIQGIVTALFFRSTRYGLYSGYVFSLLVILAVSDGTIRLLLPGEWHLAGYFSLYYALLASFGFLLALFVQLVPVKKHLPEVWKTVKLLFGIALLLLVVSHSAFFNWPNYPLWAYKIGNSLFLLFPLLLVGLSLYFGLKYRYKQALWLLIVFGLTLVFIGAFALLPYIHYDFAEFMQFKWIILFEGIAVLIVLNRDFYLTRKANTALQLQVLDEQHKASMNYLTGIADERRRVAAQLHDEISIQLAALKMAMGKNDQAGKQELGQFSHQLDVIHQQIRATSHALSPIHLERKGLQLAIEEEVVKLEDHFPDLAILPDLQIENQRFPAQIEEFVYWTFLELMHNVIKHAHASEVEISLSSSHNQLLLVLRDNGVGYHPQPGEHDGIGLNHIRNRATIAGGRFEILVLERGMEHRFSIPVSEN